MLNVIINFFVKILKSFNILLSCMHYNLKVRYFFFLTMSFDHQLLAKLLSMVILLHLWGNSRTHWLAGFWGIDGCFLQFAFSYLQFMVFTTFLFMLTLEWSGQQQGVVHKKNIQTHRGKWNSARGCRATSLTLLSQ